MRDLIRETLSILVLCAALTAIALASENEYSIEVNVTGAEPGTGQLLISLFNSSESFLAIPLVQATGDIDGQGNALVSLGTHVPGEYAIAVVYDKNENGKLDTGLFRIPKEEIGFSNNSKGKFGPAKWDDARFILTDSDASIDIQLTIADR